MRTETMQKKPRRPTSPGEILKAEYMDPLGYGITEIAAFLGIVPAQVSKLIKNQQRCGPEMAVRLSKLTNTTPEFWINLQTAVDLHQLRLDTFLMGRINNIQPLPGLGEGTGSETAEAGKADDSRQ